jgi:hypothetical protein
MAKQTKPLIFVSHITEESEIAAALKSLIEETFHGAVDVFVSSTSTSIRLGDEWLARIKHSLKTCSVAVVFVSSRSLDRARINFEAGAVWSREKPVVPLCHSGATKDDLPHPLGMLQAGNATEVKHLNDLFLHIAESFGGRPPEIDFSDLITKIREHENTTLELEEAERESPMTPTQGLLPNEIGILVEIGDRSEPNSGIAMHELKSLGQDAGLRTIPTILAYKALKMKGLIEDYEAQQWNSDPYDAIRLTDNGWGWLQQNHHLIEQEYKPPKPKQEKPRGSMEGDDIPF